MRFFGHKRPVRNERGDIVGDCVSPVKARTSGELGTQYGPDRGKRLVVTLDIGDVISLRPEKTRRVLCIQATDLYAMLVRRHAENERRSGARRKA